MRRELDVLVAKLSSNPHIRDLALTTNGIRLAERIRGLRAAGLDRVTVSLDTLDRERFRQLTRRDAHDRVLAGIEAAAVHAPEGLKIDTVVMRGINDQELCPLLEYGRKVGAEVRFIEYMDVGGALRWSADQVVSRSEMLARLSARYGSVTAVGEETSAPADRFVLPDGLVFGIISSTTAPFCSLCDRSRLTADGMWFLCLYANEGINLRTLLRAGASQEKIGAVVGAAWSRRENRGAEERLGTLDRGPLEMAKGGPHLEMHTRGG